MLWSETVDVRAAVKIDDVLVLAFCFGAMVQTRWPLSVRFEMRCFRSRRFEGSE